MTKHEVRVAVSIPRYIEATSYEEAVKKAIKHVEKSLNGYGLAPDYIGVVESTKTHSCYDLNE